MLSESESDSTDEHHFEKESIQEVPSQTNAVEMMFLHPSSLFFDLLAHSRNYLVPLLLGLFGAARGDVYTLVISGVLFVPAVGMSIFRYVTLRYRIEDGQLIVDQGVIFKKTRTVPVAKIQNIDLVQNVLHRMLGVAEVKIETASGTEPEAVLRVLSMSQMEKLRSEIFGADSRSVGASSPEHEGPVFEPVLYGPRSPDDSSGGSADLLMPQSEPSATILKIPISNLVRAGLASNRGLLTIGFGMTLYFQFFEQTEFGVFRALERWLPNVESLFWVVILSVAGLLAAMVMLRLLGVGWFLLRFFGYQLERRGDDLRISCGLLTKVSATVPRNRIQFISIHRHWMMRLMGLCSIRIETAGGSVSQQNASESVGKRWFVPVVALNDVPRILAELRPGLSWDESEIPFQPLAARAKNRLMRIAVILSILLSLAGLAISRPWGILPGVVLLPVAILWATYHARAMRYARTEKSVIYQSGIMTQKLSITFFEKIQTLKLSQSPFDRRWSMARLTVDTAAAGPADHRISVPMLDETFAQEEFQSLREMTGKNQPVFG